MKLTPFLILASSICLSAFAAIPANIEGNLKAGAAMAKSAASRQGNPASNAREARRQAYLLAEANEAAVRQQILARLLAAKTPEEVDAATAELHDRWLAAQDSILALKAAAEVVDAAPAASASD